MEKEVLKKYRKAESINNSCIIYAKSLLKENARILDIAEKIEEKMNKLGGKPAWPVNISINENAAHYTPDINDSTILKSGDLVKVDMGVHVNGYISDKAFTVCVGEKSHPLIEASEKGLKEALKLIKSGTKILEISEVVEDTLNEFGFNPIRNLCGHGLERYDQHTSPSIPNGKNNIEDEIEAGSVIAMEVFATDGSGWVKESSPSLIFSWLQDKPVRLYEARQMLKMAKIEFKKLPFAKRWFDYSPLKIDLALKQLLEVDAIKEYPVLKERSDGLVAQTEETVIVK